MTCTIDIGNTSAKLVLWTPEGSYVHFSRLSGTWSEAFAALAAQYCRFSRVYISNVAGPQPELEAALAELQQQSGTLPSSPAGGPQSGGLEVRWLTWDLPEASRWVSNIPAGLGADRLAAIVGARAAAPDSDLIVVDAGTCLTFDVVRRDGRIMGGNISPGVALRLKAMHEHTAALPLFGPEGDAPEMGFDLPTAMRGGAVNGVKWEIEGFTRAIWRTMPEARLFSTGGNLFDFAPDVAARTTCDPLLVHKGLIEFFGAPRA